MSSPCDSEHETSEDDLSKPDLIREIYKNRPCRFSSTSSSSVSVGNSESKSEIFRNISSASCLGRVKTKYPIGNRVSHTLKPFNSKKKYAKLSSSPSFSEAAREQGGNYSIEISGRSLNVFGQGALSFLDRAWCLSRANEIYSINFNYVNFNHICIFLSKLKLRFVNAEDFIFKDTNIFCVGQLNALAEVQKLSSLTIDREGNQIYDKDWKSYAIYRLTHWGLKRINNAEITEHEVSTVMAKYQSLNDLVFFALPNSLLHPLLSKLCLDALNADVLHGKAKQWLMSTDPALKTVLSTEALQWKNSFSSSSEDLTMRQKAIKHMTTLISDLCSSLKKKQMLKEQWPAILAEFVRNALIDYSQMDLYVKQCIQNLINNLCPV